MTDIVAQKMTKLDSPFELERFVHWGVVNEKQKMIAITVGVTGFATQDIIVEVENSILSIKGNNPEAPKNSEPHSKFDVKFKLGIDVHVLSAFKDNNSLIINLIYDCPNVMGSRKIEITEL